MSNSAASGSPAPATRTAASLSVSPRARGGRGSGKYGVADFFFQAEDGIRDVAVTGVQTCALPISCRRLTACLPNANPYAQRRKTTPFATLREDPHEANDCTNGTRDYFLGHLASSPRKIGRASCRERV